MSNLDAKCVNAIRILSADAIQKAKSGHPGLPLGSAAAGFELWARHMKHNAKNPTWADRDRFVLSGGHGSMLLYSLLHLFGWGLTLDDLKAFRQDGSRTPGHPEFGRTVGVEATTGPLGAGIGIAVGLAMAEAHLAAIFNKPGYPIVDHYTFVLGGDGCLMEGVSSEALSLAGTLGLAKLIVLYDSNRITIEGSTDLAFTEDVAARIAAFGFQTLTVEDGNDLAAIGRAIEEAKADTGRPSFITIRTDIGYGCPAKQGKASAHGEPLGVENVKALRKTLDWPLDEPFAVPEEVYAHCADFARSGEQAEAAWQKMFAEYKEKFPDGKRLWETYHAVPDEKDLLADPSLRTFEDKPQATRSLSGQILNRLKDSLPQLFGGSADLGPSNKSEIKDGGDFGRQDYAGRNIHFGVREMAMAAAADGIALHGGLRPYAATFFVFSDYMKPMMRLAALMKLPVIYLLTHDSIGVGEDGPTHEPVEQLATLRAMPNLIAFRPADATETAVGWCVAAASRETPTALILSRQNLPPIAATSGDAIKGGYIIADSRSKIPQAILIASGSEVALALEAKALLDADGVDVRVVSMPSMDLFDRQSEEYKERVLPKRVRARVAVEALSGFGWEKYVGLDGAMITMTSFGASAPGSVLFKKYGFTKENIAATVKKLLV